MPIQVYMPSAYIQERFTTIPEEDENEEMDEIYTAEEKSGDLLMISQDNRRMRVQLMIYRTTSEHFAIVYPQAKINKPLGFLNLKNTSCHKLTGVAESGIVLRQNGFDNPSTVTFICDSSRDVDSWITGLSTQPSSFIRQSSLPDVVEEDEEF